MQLVNMLQPGQISKKARDAVGQSFFYYGEFCLKRPWAPILVSAIFFLVCIPGIVLLETESDRVKLFIPNDIPAYTNREFISDTFGDEIRSSAVFLIGKENGIVSSMPLMREAFKLHKAITGDVVDWCARTNSAVPCRWVDLFFTLNITTEAEVDARVKDGSIAEALVQLDAYRKVENKECLRLTYLYESKGDWDEFETWRENWETAAIDTVITRQPQEFESYAILNNALVSAETKKITSGEFPLMMACMFLIVTFVTVMISGKPCLRSRIALGSVTILSVGLAMICALGLSGYVGVKTNAVTNLVFFVLLGIGVDDMIVIIRHCDMEEGTCTERIPKGLRDSGMAITLTSFTSFCAFASATQVPMIIISDFCAVGMFGIAADFIMQMTFFVGLFVYDERRRDKGKYDVCCCVKSGQSGAAVLAGSIVNGRKGLVDRGFGRFSLALRHPLGVIVSGVSWVLLVALPASQLSKVTTDLDVKSYYPPDSPLTLGLAAQETYFEGAASTMSVYIDHSSIDDNFFSDPQLFALDDTYVSLTNLDWVMTFKTGRATSDWTVAFRRWLYNSSWPSGTVAPGAHLVNSLFKEQLGAFLNAQRFAINSELACPPWCIEPWEFKRDIVLENGLPSWSRIGMLAEWAKRSSKKSQQKKDVKSIADEKLWPIDGFLHADIFLDIERDDRILLDLVQSLSITCAVVAGVVMVLLHPVVGLFVGCCIALIDLSVLGILISAGTPLTTVAYLNLSMVIGMCVDYVVHSSQAMLQKFQEGHDPDAVFEDSLAKVGRAIAEGAISALLGFILPAFFGRSDAARNFGQTMCLAIAFGAAYGLVWGPTAMYLVMQLLQRAKGAAHNVEGPTGEKSELQDAVNVVEPSAEQLKGAAHNVEVPTGEKSELQDAVNVVEPSAEQMRHMQVTLGGPTAQQPELQDVVSSVQHQSETSEEDFICDI